MRINEAERGYAISDALLMLVIIAIRMNRQVPSVDIQTVDQNKQK